MKRWEIQTKEQEGWKFAANYEAADDRTEADVILDFTGWLSEDNDIHVYQPGYILLNGEPMHIRAIPKEGR